MRSKLSVRVLLALLAASPISVEAQEVTSGKSRPNVLVIVADDLAERMVGVAGNPNAHTPNIDRLARQGVRFTHAFCNAPVCTASRQSLLTGRLPQQVGVTVLRTPLSVREITLADVFAEHGYRTAAFGKMHFNSARKHGFQERAERGRHRQWLGGRARQPLPSGVETLPAWKPFRDPAEIWLNAAALPYPATDEEMAGTWIAGLADEFLGRSSDQPFFLMVSFYEPHSPFHFPVEYAGAVDPSTLPVHQPGPEDDWQIPQIFRDLTSEQQQGIRAAYLTSVRFLDANVGRVLDSLERSGHADETLVVFLGDHGYMLGEHGRYEKHCFFEEAVRSPLVFRWEGRWQATVTPALTEFVDIAPTVLEACGIRPPAEMTGRSLLELLDGRTDRHRERIFSLYAENEEAMLRDERWKFVYCSGKRDRQDGYATGERLPGRLRRLYDLATDPAEMRNLAGEPGQAERVQLMEKELLRRLENGHHRLGEMPEGLEGADRLDWLLTPRDRAPDS